MTRNKRNRSRGMKKSTLIRLLSITLLNIVLIGVVFLIVFHKENDIEFNNAADTSREITAEDLKEPEDILKLYMSYIDKKQFEDMYEILDEQSRQTIGAADFIERNKNIYEGIDAENVTIQINDTEKSDDKLERTVIVYYESKMDSLAGEIEFLNQAVFTKNAEGKYKLSWDDRIIFPNLGSTDKVRVYNRSAKRGKITDRNDKELAGWGTASSVGLVPGKMSEESAADIEKIAELLDLSAESISKKLEANWVKEDSFVPIKLIEKITQLDLNPEFANEEAIANKEMQDRLLEIPGVMLTDTEVRSYPYGKAAAHLTGYIQSVTAEDLEKHQGEGYSENSVIGRSGMEALYEKELKGEDGVDIAIVDSNDQQKMVLASIPKKDGETIKLTIDADLQKSLYESFSEDKSCTVAMDPYSGEVLALVSTPSFDSNDFILGMSNSLWTSLNEDERMPLYNRFRQKLSPGSSFKPIIAAIGLETGDLSPDKEYESEGLSWQKDASWGNYFVTTLHDYKPVILENALINSDNIFFAKAALEIGGDKLMDSLDKLGFNQDLPFEISVAQSRYSNSEDFETEIQLADSGYGQGQVLVNPIHLAAIYTGFANEGNILKPYLRYSNEREAEIWLPQAFSAENANIVKNAMEKVISSPDGTGRAAYTEAVQLAGKTGTAEIKLSKDDKEGTELGWFNVFTADKNIEKPIMLISMVEDVKTTGGSGYVVRKIKTILDEYLK